MPPSPATPRPRRGEGGVASVDAVLRTNDPVCAPVHQHQPLQGDARKQPTTWSSTMPVACMSAYAVVGPTKTKPRRFSSLAIAIDSGLVAGTSARVAGRVRGPVGANDQSRAD